MCGDSRFFVRDGFSQSRDRRFMALVHQIIGAPPKVVKTVLLLASGLGGARNSTGWPDADTPPWLQSRPMRDHSSLRHRRARPGQTHPKSRKRRVGCPCTPDEMLDDPPHDRPPRWDMPELLLWGAALHVLAQRQARVQPKNSCVLPGIGPGARRVEIQDTGSHVALHSVPTAVPEVPSSPVRSRAGHPHADAQQVSKRQTLRPTIPMSPPALTPARRTPPDEDKDPDR